jgi:hypothetical protein
MVKILAGLSSTAITMRVVRKIGLATLASAFVLIESSCGPTNFNVDQMKIGSDLHLIPIGHRTPRDLGRGSHYFFFHTGTGLTTVDHMDTRPSGRERLLYLETGTNQVLDRTVKREEILKGGYGTVYSTKTCFYASPLARGYSSVSVGGGNNGIAEVPTELANAPEVLPPLTSVSVIRIFRVAPEYVVVAGNYEPDGKMGSLQISGAKSGDRDPSFGGGIFVFPGVTGQPTALAKQYGMPARIDVQNYLGSHRLVLPGVDLPEEIQAVDLHYGYDKLIRQDTIDDGTTRASRFLKPSVTSEEKILDPLCESRFRQQKDAGFPTVF